MTVYYPTIRIFITLLKHICLLCYNILLLIGKDWIFPSCLLFENRFKKFGYISMVKYHAVNNHDSAMNISLQNIGLLE